MAAPRRISRIGASVAEVGDRAVPSSGGTIRRIWYFIKRELTIQHTRSTGLERGIEEGVPWVVLSDIRGSV